MTRERGVAMILALLFLSFLTILGGALLTNSTVDIRISDNYRAAAQSLYVAEAGIEEAREMIRTSASTPAELLVSASGGDGVISASTDLASLLSSDDRPLIPSDPWIRDMGQSLVDGSGQVAGHYHVWLRNDNADGIPATADTNHILTLLSVGTVGNARKTIEVTIKQSEFPHFPAALMLDGPVDTFNATDSSFFEVNGNDEVSGEAAYSIGVIRDSDIALLAGEVSQPSDRTANYIGRGGLMPDLRNTSSEMDPMLRSPASLEKIVTRISRNASDVFDPTYGSAQPIQNYGSPTDYKIAVVNGDVALGPGAGYGMLVARGNVTVVGNFTWSGLILIVGQGVLHWNGDQSGSILGSMFIARTRANDRGPSNIFGTGIGMLGSVTANFSGAAGSGIHYNSAAIAAASHGLPYMPISVKEW